MSASSTCSSATTTSRLGNLPTHVLSEVLRFLVVDDLFRFAPVRFLL